MRTIIFDFGNVVGFFDHYRALAKLAPFTTLAPDAMYQSVYAGDIEDIFEKGHLSEIEFLRRVVGLWRLRCESDRLAEAIADIFEPNPEICELIPRLARRYRLMLGSNTNVIHARKFRLQFADVLEHFQHLVLSFEIGARKPSREFFEHCLEHAGCAAQECVFVDDLAANVEGARQLGMKGVVYRAGAGLERELREIGVELY
jgi:HAD superfamily hydrolase (TIGR01549 family)